MNDRLRSIRQVLVGLTLFAAHGLLFAAIGCRDRSVSNDWGGYTCPVTHDRMESTMRIPTADDWENLFGDMDIACARRNFGGKTLPEAYRMFVDNALYYQEDIMFMPTRCFYFYVRAYIDYLFSQESKGDSDAANCFFGIVRCRNEDIRGGPEFLRQRIRQLLLHLRGNQSWYDAWPEIYGDFTAKADEVLALISVP